MHARGQKHQIYSAWWLFRSPALLLLHTSAAEFELKRARVRVFQPSTCSRSHKKLASKQPRLQSGKSSPSVLSRTAAHRRRAEWSCICGRARGGSKLGCAVKTEGRDALLPALAASWCDECAAQSATRRPSASVAFMWAAHRHGDSLASSAIPARRRGRALLGTCEQGVRTGLARDGWTCTRRKMRGEARRRRAFAFSVCPGQLLRESSEYKQKNRKHSPKAELVNFSCA
mmetsp:Transcript_6297/g.16807  ORF Transcript_6297/g.16807 Transcript_6297/m.16807 type:complete len:230 (+) Transcript_6297:422-1111(+)